MPPPDPMVELLLANETGELTVRLKAILTDHQRQEDSTLHPTTMSYCASFDHGTLTGRTTHWPCTTFKLAAAQLRIVEIIDGTRFSTEWPGPVEERYQRGEPGVAN